jgi:serine phosphatase RsbU (regulator of sigma subunit)
VRQLREDEEAGRNIQFQLLPRDGCALGGYTFSRRLFPSAYLSGDFVDYFGIDTRHLGFYMADVAGHGAASAFVTVMLTTLVREFREEYRVEGDATILDPEGMLGRLNREFCGQRFKKHLTIFYGVIDRDQNRLRCCSGGQYPYPILRHGREVRFLPVQGVPVGMFDYAEFQGRSIALPERFDLVLISDGVLEILRLGAPKDGRDALLSKVAQSDRSIDGLTTELGLEGQELPDDVALLWVSKH